MSNPVFSENTFRQAEYGAVQDTMTVNGSIMKTFILGLVFIMTSFALLAYLPNILHNGGASFGKVLIVSAVAACVVGLIISFKPVTSPYLSVLYAVLESVVVTTLSVIMNMQYNGIVFEAVTYTMITFFVMLILFRFNIISATAKFKAVIFTATTAVALSYIILFVLSFFGIRPEWFYGNSTLSIIINAVVIVIAALNLIIDFDFVVRGAEQKMPKYMEWYAAFGLMVTIIWLYIEMLRILSRLKER